MFAHYIRAFFSFRLLCCIMLANVRDVFFVPPGILFYLKMHLNGFRGWALPRCTGELTVLVPMPFSWIKEGKGMDGSEETERKGRVRNGGCEGKRKAGRTPIVCLCYWLLENKITYVCKQIKMKEGKWKKYVHIHNNVHTYSYCKKVHSCIHA